MRVIGLYLHIPFCQAICSYCNFNRGLLDPALKERYVTALEREIRGHAPAGAGADTIFFGGGTPSLLDPDEVARLIGACRDAFALDPRAEITLETNPETATAERLAGFRAAGVTRLSFGVQSFDDDELARLGRIHSAAGARDAVRMAKATGFESVSFDLMFWLPGQTVTSWLRTVDEAIALAPDHLSLYLLELYPNAPLKESLARAGDAAPWAQASDDEAAEMYLSALERLDDAGFEQYEISNVARTGHISRHNVKYWQSGNWLGFGCGAHSTLDGVRWRNVSATAEYVERIGRGASAAIDVQSLSARARLEEALFTGLRLRAGVTRRDIVERHGVDPWDRYGADLDPYVEEGLMWADEVAFGLSRRGMLVANEILTAFV
jgi:oxygen-independent coproporphyrinogen-3 oxidase